MNVEQIDILGVRVDNVTTEETLDLMASFVAEGHAHQVVTVNPEFVMRAQRDEAFHVVLDEAHLALPDGYGLLWASRVLGKPLHQRVTGSDTLPLIARMSAERGYGIFLLGAAPGVAERAAAVLRRDNPRLRVVGAYAGSPDQSQADEIVAHVTAASPDFLFVAYGAPRQDLWIRRNLDRLGVPVCMGVGGTFDFVAGITPRAPLWMRERGLEWVHRLVHQPWRWRRMLALPLFVCLVLRQAIVGIRRD